MNRRRWVGKGERETNVCVVGIFSSPFLFFVWRRDEMAASHYADHFLLCALWERRMGGRSVGRAVWMRKDGKRRERLLGRR